MNDLPVLAPSGVTIVFPSAGSSQPASGFYAIGVPLGSLQLVQYRGVVGAPWNHTINRYESATFSGGNSGTPANLSTLQSLATQVATDWYRWRLGRLEQQYAGIVAADPGAHHDREWIQEGQIKTRVSVKSEKREDLIAPSLSKLDLFGPNVTNIWYSVNNYYGETNFYFTSNYYSYFTWQPIIITDPGTGIVLDPGTAPKLQIVTGPFVIGTEQQLGDGVALPEIQRIWVVNATGGTFSLVLTSADGTQTAVTAAIAWNAAAGSVQTAINNAAATFTVPYTVGVTGAGTVGSPWVVTFSGFAPYFFLLPRYDPLTGPVLTLEYTGISGGVHGRILVIEVAGPGPVILLDASSAGAATAYAVGQGIFCPLGFDYTIWPDNAVMLEYDAYGDGVHGGWRFMHPTFGASSASNGDLVYACNRLYFSTGLTFTPNGDGTAVVTANEVCLVNNQVTGTTAITDGSVTLSTFSLTIPSDGTYKVIVRVSASATNTLGSLTLTATGYLEINGVIIQQGPMFHTSLEPQSAGSITFDLHDGLVAGDVIKAACQIVPAESGRSFDYTISYLKICGPGGS